MKHNGKDDRDVVEAKERAARAQVYARLFPEFVRPHDMVYQTVEYQLKQLQSFKQKCCPAK